MYDMTTLNRLKSEMLTYIANGITEVEDLGAALQEPLPVVEELIRILVKEKKIKMTRHM